MKNLLLISTFALITFQVFAQSDKEIELEELITPSIPAFTLLGLSPTEINRPTLLKPFAVGLANSISSEGSIAPDIAIETSPFWYFDRSEYSFEKYFNIDDSLNVVRASNIWETLAISIGSKDISIQDSTEARLLAGGLRFQIINGKPSSAFYEALAEIRNIQKMDQVLQKVDALLKNENYTINQLETIIEEQALILLNTDPYTRNWKDFAKTDFIKVTKTEILKTIYNLNTENDKTYAGSKIKDALKTLESKLTVTTLEDLVTLKNLSRVGLIWEVAAASALSLPTNRIDYTFGDEWAIWSTLTHRFDNTKNSDKTNDLNIMYRRTGNFMNSKNHSNDFAFSWVLSGKDYSLSAEIVARLYKTRFEIEGVDGNFYPTSDSDWTSKYAVSFQYRLNSVVNLTASFGKDYDNVFNTGGNLFTLINANFLIPTKQTLSGQSN